MTTNTPARDFLLPALNDLIASAAGHGIARDVAVAVLIDLVTGPGFNDVPLDPGDEAPANNTGTFPISVEESAINAGERVPVGPFKPGKRSGSPFRPPLPHLARRARPCPCWMPR